MSDLSNLQQEAVAQFVTAIKDKGLAAPDKIIADGKRHYFSSSAQKPNNAGWYVYHNDAIPHGSFGDYRTNVYVRSWTVNPGRAFTEAEQLLLEQARISKKAQNNNNQERLNNDARIRSLNIVNAAVPADNQHPYLLKKGVDAHSILIWNTPVAAIKHNENTGKDYLELKSSDGKARVSFLVDLTETTAEKVIQDWQSVLLIPMFNKDDELQSLQFISKTGAKKFLYGGKMQGSFFPIGKLRDTDTILIAEGYATASTIYENTGVPTVVAYNAGNLKSVAQEIRSLYPDARIILCADDDHQTEGNPGVTKAREAAAAVNGTVFVPEFGANRPKGATDFNDMALRLGNKAVTEFFASKFSETVASAQDNRPRTPDDPDKSFFEHLFFSNPEVKPKPYYRNTPLEPDVPPASATHFTPQEFQKICDIWKNVPRQSTTHNHTGYHIHLSDTRKVTVAREMITIEKSLWRKPPDEVYIAACEQAQRLWGGRMEVIGDSHHCISAMAYATAYGVEVTNFAPTSKEQAEIDKLVKSIRAAMEPSPGRPTSRASRTYGFCPAP